MRKNLWLMIALGLLEQVSFAQTQLGYDRYFYTGDVASFNIFKVLGGKSSPSINVTRRYNLQSFFLFSQKDSLVKNPSAGEKVKRINVALKPAKNVPDADKNISGNNPEEQGNITALKQADTIEQKNIAGNSNPEPIKPQNTKSEFSTSSVNQTKNNISDLQIINLESPYVTDKDKLLYAVILSPFKDKHEAIFIKSRLLAVFNTQSILYADGSNFKIRIPGFRYHTEAELYAHKAINSGFKNKFYIIPYEIKSVNPTMEEPKTRYTITERH